MNGFNSRLLKAKAKEKIGFLENSKNLANNQILFSALAMCHKLMRFLQTAHLTPTRKPSNQVLPTPNLHSKISLFLSKYEDYLFLSQKVMTSPPELFLSPASSHPYTDIEYLNEHKHMLRPALEPFYRFQHYSICQFPKKKNIIFDSGKLNRLITILRDLRSKNHKCLIFT